MKILRHAAWLPFIAIQLIILPPLGAQAPSNESIARLIERNAQAVGNMKEGDFNRALEVLGTRIEASEIEEGQEASYGAESLNRARAYEELNKPEAALDEYLFAIKLDPLAETAVRRSIRIVDDEELGEFRYDGLEKLVDRTANRSPQAVVEDVMRTALDLVRSPEGRGARRRVLQGFIDYVVRFQPSIEFFQETWTGRLSEIPAEPGSVESRKLRYMSGAYAEQHEVDEYLDGLRYEEVPGPYFATAASAWLSKRVQEQALIQYLAAWESGKDLDYAASAINLIVQQNRESEPAGATIESIRQRFEFELFSEKGAAYSSGDTDAIYRCHNMLGLLFENQHRWGAGSGDVEGAQFHWVRALRVLKREPELSEEHANDVPFLYFRLAYAAGNSGEPVEVCESYYRAGMNAAEELGLDWDINYDEVAGGEIFQDESIAYFSGQSGPRTFRRVDFDELNTELPSLVQRQLDSGY